MSRKTKSKTEAPAEPAEVIVSYKGFDRDMKCRGYQYEIGKCYEHPGEVIACPTKDQAAKGMGGFHACEHPLDVFGYYPPAGSRFAVVHQSGALARHSDDTKIASAKITIEAELHLGDMIQRAVDWVIGRATPEEGGHATGASGAASATGDRGAAMASGRDGRAQGADGCALFLVRRNLDWKITHAWAGIVGRDGGIKPLTWYTLDDSGQPVEVAS